MIAAARPPRASNWSSSGAVAWCRARPWLYLCAVIGAWALVPEVRRLVDWRAGFSAVSVISIVPLLALLAAALPFLYSGRLHTVDRDVLACAWLWFGGFTYALLVGMASGGVFPALYGYAVFVLPAMFGLWVAALRIPRERLYERVASFSLWLAVPVTLYGVVQFIAPPPWDVAWMLSAKISSIGQPYAFQFRPFSTLNAPGPFADFLLAVLVLNLPRLRGANPLRVALLAVCTGGLVLTMVRSDWIAFAIAVVCYVVLSPKRGRNLAILTGTGIALAMAVVALNTSAGAAVGQAGFSVLTRLQTFNDLDRDRSVTDRWQYFDDALRSAAEQPLGAGLGVLGTAAKLTDAAITKDFDNGYIARFTEMGYFGMVCYVLALAIALRFAFVRWRVASREERWNRASIAAAILALQVALVVLDLSSDHHSAFAGVFFWLTLGILGSDE